MTERHTHSPEPLLGLWNKAEPLVPLFFIWGLQQLLNSAYDIFIRWITFGSIKPYTAAAGLILTLIVLGRSALTVNRMAGFEGLRSALRVTLPFWILLGSVLLLNNIQAVDLYFTDLFRSLMLSFFYIWLGLSVSRHLTRLGLWLFVLCVVLGLGYPGFSPVVLELYGGLSLVAGAILLRFTK